MKKITFDLQILAVSHISVIRVKVPVKPLFSPRPLAPVHQRLVHGWLQVHLRVAACHLIYQVLIQNVWLISYQYARRVRVDIRVLILLEVFRNVTYIRQLFAIFPACVVLSLAVDALKFRRINRLLHKFFPVRVVVVRSVSRRINTSLPKILVLNPLVNVDVDFEMSTPVRRIKQRVQVRKSRR